MRFALEAAIGRAQRDSALFPGDWRATGARSRNPGLCAGSQPSTGYPNLCRGDVKGSAWRDRSQATRP